MARRSFAGCALLLAVAAAGCGANVGRVSGKVTFKGSPLPSGTVQFFCADGSIAHSLLMSDGSYLIPKVPCGDVRITVKSHGQLPIGMLKGARNAPGGRALPKEL